MSAFALAKDGHTGGPRRLDAEGDVPSLGHEPVTRLAGRHPGLAAWWSGIRLAVVSGTQYRGRLLIAQDVVFEVIMIPANRDHHAFCGIVAGFLATAVLSGAMSVMVPAGLAPDIIGLISHTLRTGRDTGWLVHFLVGTVAWGGFFAILQPFLPSRTALVRGMMFGVAAWVAMMLILMPMADAGYFGLLLGWTTPFTTLLLHLIFGASLGLACSLLPLPDYERGEAGMLRRGH